MLEAIIEKVILKLDFIDLNIIEQLLMNDGFLAFPTLVKRLKKINVWDRGIIRRRINGLRNLKILYFEDNTNPLLIEYYEHNDKNLFITKELLKKRLIRY